MSQVVCPRCKKGAGGANYGTFTENEKSVTCIFCGVPFFGKLNDSGGVDTRTGSRIPNLGGR